jgi:D-alanyl-D-alanine carboxypeptidase
MGALAATVSVYAAYASPASDVGVHELQRATHESSWAPPYSAIVLDVNSGKVLHSVNADELRHPASLTKIMTLYLLFERLETGKLRLDTQLAVSEHAAIQAPTKLGLTPGQMITVEDAIGGLVTKSANDAAVVIAEALVGDEHEFTELMTRKAHALGMSRTVYRNASGLPDDEQVTTARDQALLGRAIQERFPGYYRYFAMSSFKYHGQTMLTHNQLLGQVEGLDGIKTGYTKASGFNLVTSVRRDSRHIVSVVLGGASAGARDARMRSLIEECIVVATPQKGATATAHARKEPAEMRGTVAEPSTKGTHAADARPANQQTEPATYSVASYERPIRPLSSATPPSTVRATTADKPLAGPITDRIAAAGMHVPLASDPIRPIPVKTVNVKLSATFGTPALEQIEIPEASRDDPSAPKSKSAPQAFFKPQPPWLPHRDGILLSPEQSARNEIAPLLSATPQSAAHRAAASGVEVYSGWSVPLFWTVIATYKPRCAIC